MKKFSVCMLGSGGVGKTSITLQFTRGEFSETYIPTIEDEFQKNLKVNNETVQLEIIDTAGQDDFKDLRHRYIKECDAFIFVYSVDDPDSLTFISSIFQDCKANSEFPKVVVMGNKSDLFDKKVDLESVKKIASDWGNPPIFESSAKTNKNINQAFETIAKILLGQNLSQNSNEGCCSII